MLNKFRKDIERYKAYSGKNSLVLLFTQQGLWALCVYRINNSIYSSSLPGIFKKILLFFGLLWQKWIEIICGISIPYSARIGEGFYIGHFGNIIINSDVEIGRNCNISQGVTIGVSGRGEKRGVPSIGDHVYMGANAVIAGKIKVGDNSVIAANSLVVSDVDPGCTYLGVPAVKINNNNSEAYI
ncbi:serine acetyltransferase [Leptobacterium flavescens]|uniref:Serine acetyltransferase n=1 Tax=Leptobacterium flavescens TaxID=472055 RepID=A0A6P0UGM1_9FLAO|nr:DapH/DapD/GlmU-related protein [Leptobacterium flavescens]NER12167.1 serine acetyltransferase [Leptobacterium flavescens]